MELVVDSAMHEATLQPCVDQAQLLIPHVLSASMGRACPQLCLPYCVRCASWHVPNRCHHAMHAAIPVWHALPSECLALLGPGQATCFNCMTRLLDRMNTPSA